MCQGCCKALCVKISYTILIGAVFATGLFFSFDVYLQSLMFQSNKFQNAAPVTHLAGCHDEASIKTSLTHIPIGSGYYNSITKCFSAEKDVAADEYFNYKNGDSTQVYVNTSVDGSYTMKPVDVTCVSKEYVNEDQSNAIVYYVSAGCSWGGLGLGALLLICIWFCCSDWCRCCCCKPKVGIVTNGHIYV
ncbi:Transmembrane_domain-containing protein [Hexamita inflata]|uniref:Transmembrane domain-containing protein n=1 Tax=Hexamita inflata TaxID=28002 RepID=A0AA86TSM2_9EUKA|nr:Transmembrane domain-containing protein [Hexamita inflata]